MFAEQLHCITEKTKKKWPLHFTYSLYSLKKNKYKKQMYVTTNPLIWSYTLIWQIRALKMKNASVFLNTILELWP